MDFRLQDRMFISLFRNERLAEQLLSRCTEESVFGVRDENFVISQVRDLRIVATEQPLVLTFNGIKYDMQFEMMMFFSSK